jgi:hypothetical protein
LQAEPRYRTKNVEIHERHGHVGYYRGIRAAKLERHAVMTYNVMKNLKLTEDRTIDNIYAFNAAVRDAVLESRIARIRVRLPAGARLAPSRRARSRMLDDAERDLPAGLRARDFRDIANASALKIYKKHRKIELLPDSVPLNKIETMQLTRATKFAEFMGYPVSEYPVVVTSDLGEHVWGRAYEGRIYINRSAFANGTKIVAGTLIEEFIHLRHKLDDESRQLQNHLLNALVSMGELAWGEPI